MRGAAALGDCAATFLGSVRSVRNLFQAEQTLLEARGSMGHGRSTVRCWCFWAWPADLRLGYTEEKSLGRRNHFFP